MSYVLIPASEEHTQWLERLRRDAYQELFQMTFGGWDEARHQLQFRECWKRGGIFIVEVADQPVGMIQLLTSPDAVEVGEIQILPGRQSQGIGTQVLINIIARAHEERKKVTLRVGLKNDRAFRLYERLGFIPIRRSETHTHMVCHPQR